jgi:multidrug transporter EmrE-like cation transporter
MEPPHDYRRMYFQWFECPSCGYSRLGAMSKVEMAADYKQMKLLALCERCKSVCKLKRPAINAAILLTVGGPFLFAPTFYAIAAALPASLGVAYAIPAGLGAAAVSYLGVLILGRFTQKYVPADDGAA